VRVSTQEDLAIVNGKPFNGYRVDLGENRVSFAIWRNGKPFTLTFTLEESRSIALDLLRLLPSIRESDLHNIIAKTVNDFPGHVLVK